jgi:hypothetical protein
MFTGFCVTPISSFKGRRPNMSRSVGRCIVPVPSQVSADCKKLLSLTPRRVASRNTEKRQIAFSLFLNA